MSINLKSLIGKLNDFTRKTLESVRRPVLDSDEL